MSNQPDWFRVKRHNGAHVRIRLASIEMYLPNGAGGTDLFLAGGERVSLDIDISAQLDSAFVGSTPWVDLP